MGRKKEMLPYVGWYYKVKSPPGDKNHPSSHYPLSGWIVVKANNEQDLKQRLALYTLQNKEAKILTKEEIQKTLQHLKKFRTNHKVRR